MPYRLATVQPLAIETETDSGDYGITLARCLAEIDWSAKAPMQGKLINGRYYGTGIGCYLEGGASGPKESARLVLESQGKVSVYVGSSSIGQGLETVCAQIAADALEVPMSRSTPEPCSVPTGNRFRLPPLPELRPKPPMPAISEPIVTARMPPTLPSIPRRGTWSSLTMSRSRTPGASSIR